MTVLIAGGGIAGLTMGLTLHQLGIPFRIFEAVKEMRPLGVGINLQPNAVRELLNLGLEDALDQCGVHTQEYGFFTKSGLEIWTEPRGLKAGYKWPQYSLHRGRFQVALRDALIARAGAEVLSLGHAAKAYETRDSGEVVLHLAVAVDTHRIDDRAVEQQVVTAAKVARNVAGIGHRIVVDHHVDLADPINGYHAATDHDQVVAEPQLGEVGQVYHRVVAQADVGVGATECDFSAVVISDETVLADLVDADQVTLNPRDGPIRRQARGWGRGVTLDVRWRRCCRDCMCHRVHHGGRARIRESAVVDIHQDIDLRDNAEFNHVAHHRNDGGVEPRGGDSDLVDQGVCTGHHSVPVVYFGDRVVPHGGA